MDNLDCTRAADVQAFLSHRWKLSFIPTPATLSSTPHTTYMQFFLHVISVKYCALAEIKAYMHAYARAYIRTYIATYLGTYLRFMKQPLIEVCFNYLNPRRYMGFRCLSHHSLCIHAASPEPLLLSYTKQMY